MGKGGGCYRLSIIGDPLENRVRNVGQPRCKSLYGAFPPLQILLSRYVTSDAGESYPSTSLIKIMTPFPHAQNFQPSIPNSFHCFSASDTFFEKSSPIFPFVSINLYSYFFNAYNLFSGFKSRYVELIRTKYSTDAGDIQPLYLDAANVGNAQVYTQCR